MKLPPKLIRMVFHDCFDNNNLWDGMDMENDIESGGVDFCFYKKKPLDEGEDDMAEEEEEDGETCLHAELDLVHDLIDRMHSLEDND